MVEDGECVSLLTARLLFTYKRQSLRAVHLTHPVKSIIALVIQNSAKFNGLTQDVYKRQIIACVKEHPQVAGIYDLMIHDYGFGYFVISMHITGRKEHCERIHRVAEEAAFLLYKKYHLSLIHIF